MNQGFRPVGVGGSPDLLGGSWTQLDMSASGSSSEADFKAQKVSTEALQDSSPSYKQRSLSTGSDCLYKPPVDSVPLAHKRLARQGRDSEFDPLITESPLDLEKAAQIEEDGKVSGDAFTEVATSDVNQRPMESSEKDFKDLYLKTIDEFKYPSSLRDRNLDKVIRGLLQDKFIGNDIAAIKRLPIDDRSYSVFRMIHCYHTLKNERFELIYKALSQISNETMKLGLKRLVQSAEAKYTLG